MWIEFSNFNLKLLILFIFPVFIKIQDEIKPLYLKDNNFYFKTFRYFASYIFAFIPLLIIKCRSKNDNQEIIDKEKKLKEENEELMNKLLPVPTNTFKKREMKKRRYQNIIYIGILCIIGFSCYLYRKFFEKNEYWDAKQTIGVFFEIVDFVGLSYILLSQKLFKHHFIFLGIIALVLLILFIISIPFVNKDYILSSCFYFLFYSLFFGLFDVLGKRYMLKFYQSPYFLMFIIGIINATLFTIYDVFAYFFNRDISGIILGFQNNIKSARDFFIFILDLIIQSIWNHGIWLTIYYFTPCHYFISEYISEYIYFIMTAIEKEGKDELHSTVNVIIFSISDFIIIMCFLFFNEILILNICNLDHNTEKRIIERMQLEKEESNRVNILLEMEEENGERDRKTISSCSSN